MVLLTIKPWDKIGPTVAQAWGYLTQYALGEEFVNHLAFVVWLYKGETKGDLM